MVPEGKQDGILQRSERSMVRAMCGVQLYDGKRYMDLMLILGYSNNRSVAMANSARWCGHVLRREDGHIIRIAQYFEVEDQRKKMRAKRTLKKQVEEESEESVQVGVRRKEAL